MFSLRDSSSAYSSGTDEDSFGWWIGVESHAQEPDATSPTKSDSVQPSSLVSSDVSCPSSTSCAASDDYALQSRHLTTSTTTTAHPTTNYEQIELRSLNAGSDEACLDSGFGGSSSTSDCNRRAALCYTPERLVRTEDFRILAPSPRLYPKLEDLATTVAHFQLRSFEDRKIGAERLANLLQSPLCRSSDMLSRSSCRRCCCIRYGDGEVLLHTERCPRNNDEDGRAASRMRLRAPLDHSQLRPYSAEYGKCCGQGDHLDDELDDVCCPSEPDSRHRVRYNAADDLESGVSSAEDGCVGSARAEDWSFSTEEEVEVEDEESTRLPRRLSDELAYVSFEYALGARELQADKLSDINEVVSILADLESDPRRAEELLLAEDSRRSGHDSLTRLALAIEPDPRLLPAIRVNYGARWRSGSAAGGAAEAEAELEQLRDRVERLQGSSKDMYEEITALRRDFTKDEWKVNHISEDISKLRNEVCDLRYLDDLLKLLKGELERISNRNWPFAIGNTKHGTEEINLVV